MKIIKPSVEIMDYLDGSKIIKKLERCGRICYKSESSITDGSAEKFVASIIKSGHETILEHCSFTVKIICDRGVSHELVRHRLASYSQESTRYVNYKKKGMTLIHPCWFTHDLCGEYEPVCNSFGDPYIYELPTVASDNELRWFNVMTEAETAYLNLIKMGWTPQEARSVLPNSLKTEVVMTANLREWRHFFKLRALGTTGKPHPQMKEVATMILDEAMTKVPVVFDDLVDEVS